jgi:ferredoxin
MAYVVCEPCCDCKYTDCVTVCPCDCFYADDSQLYIDPDHCVDCDACVAECPVAAIFPDRDVPTPWARFIQLNSERVAVLKQTGGPLTERQEPRTEPGCCNRRPV